MNEIKRIYAGIDTLFNPCAFFQKNAWVVSV